MPMDQFMTSGNIKRTILCFCSNNYVYSPDAYNLPLEYTKLAAEHNRSKSSTERSSLEKEECVWICKPAAQSQGKGIFLFRVRT